MKDLHEYFQNKPWAALMNILFWRKIYRKLTTLWFKLKYWQAVGVTHGAVVEERVKVRSFTNNANAAQQLKIVMKPNSLIKNYVMIQDSGLFELGERSYIGSYSVIGVNEKIQIGDQVMIADHFSAKDADHKFENVHIPMMLQGYTTRPVIIEDDVWIGHGVSITSGVKIGRGTVIAAGSVVIKDIPPYSVAGGVPAKVIKARLK